MKRLSQDQVEVLKRLNEGAFSTTEMLDSFHPDINSSPKTIDTKYYSFIRRLELLEKRDLVSSDESRPRIWEITDRGREILDLKETEAQMRKLKEKLSEEGP